MAPMAGVTDAAFRMRLRRNGCKNLFTEMASAAALARGNKKTLSFIDVPDLCGDLTIQIFGADPDELAKTAEIVQEAGFARIDLNMGCPVKKVIRSGSGSALLVNLRLAEKCIKSMRRVVSGLFSVKIRSGWNDGSLNYLETGRMAADCGVDFLTIHPRTRAQGFSGLANWDHVSELAAHLDIPVIGNGDVDTAETAVEKLRSTGCAGIMIGRGALSKPWIFEESHSLLYGGSFKRPGLRAIADDLLLQLQDLARWKSPRTAVVEMRKFLIWTSKGMRGAADFRRRLIESVDLASLETEITSFFGR